MNIIGISAYYHDSAAVLLINGEIIAAAQEERFTRIKHDKCFPMESIKYCLSEGDLNLKDIDFFVFHEKPLSKFVRLLKTHFAFSPKGFKSFSASIPVWIGSKIHLKKHIISSLMEIESGCDIKSRLLFSEHHYSHAASAFFASPFDEAIVLTIDGVGELATTTVSIGKGSGLDIVKEIHFPHSLGLLYSAFTYYIGFRVNTGEYKVMGLAPYGKPKYKELILDNLIDLKNDGSFRLNQYYFDYATDLRMINEKFEKLFGQPIRMPDVDQLTQFHMDIAASIQAVTEEVVLKMASSLSKEYGVSNLCLAGGVALNCVANGKLLKSGYFNDIWVQPASGDAGGALGAALATWHTTLGHQKISRSSDIMKGTYLGPQFSPKEVEDELVACGAVFKKLSTEEVISHTSKYLSEGKAVGWFQGRMEFGPRSLGARSILGDPRSEVMQKVLNIKVKYRESFRPFAPSVLSERADAWFDLKTSSPYMLFVGDIAKDKQIEMTSQQQLLFGINKLNVVRSVIPAVTHVDYSARVQTVHKETNLIYHNLISAFEELTGCPVIVNTSFNVRGEPIVCKPKDAFRCFMGTGLDVLVVNNSILLKSEQNPKLITDYKNEFNLD